MCIYAEGLDIIGVAETHLKGKDSIHLPGYKWYGNNRDQLHRRAVTGSGGVGFLVKEELLSRFTVTVLEQDYEGIMWLQLTDKITSTCVRICVCYLPPEHSSRNICGIEFMDKLLTNIYEYQSGCTFYICGDLNARTKDLDDCIVGVDNVQPRTVIDFERSNRYGDLLCNMCISANCCILNGRNSLHDDYTSVSTKGASVVDYCIIPYEQFEQYSDFSVVRARDLYDQCGIQHLSKIPDHSLLKWKMTLDNCVTNDDQTGPTVSYVKYKLDTIPANFMLKEDTVNAINTHIQRLEHDTVNQQDIDHIYNEFCDTLHCEMQDSVQSKVMLLNGRRNNKKRVNKPWWTEHLSSLWNAVCNLEKDFTRARGLRRQQLRVAYTSKQKEFSREVQKAKRRYWYKMQQDLLSMESNQPKDFWRYIGQLGVAQERKGIPLEIVRDDGTISCDIAEVLGKWKTDFSNIQNPGFIKGSRVEEVDSFMSSDNGIDINDNSPLLNLPITCEEVLLALRKAKNRKAPGYDAVPVEVLRNETAVKFMVPLFQVCFEKGIVPTLWNKGIVCPIPKATTMDWRDPLQYRGLTLASSLYKLYCGVLNNRLKVWSEDKINDEQNGFRSKRSTIDHLSTLTGIVETRIKHGLSTYATFIDFTKAYDCINRNKLWFKLRQYGINGKFYQALRAIYQNTENCVRLNRGLMSDWFNVTSGLKQGCMLSPVLFNLYINDLLTCLKSVNCGLNIGENCVSVLAYADDLVLISDSAEKMQNQLDCLHEWCVKWDMRVNPSKSQVVHFRKSSTLRTNKIFTCGADKLEVVDSYKYLGLLLSEHLDYKLTVKTVVQSATRALGVLIAKSRAHGGLPYKVFSKLYDSLVWSVCDYAAAIWGSQNWNEVNVLHNKACRFYLGVGKYAPTAAVRGDMGWITPEERQWTAVARHYIRCKQMDNNRVNKKIFGNLCQEQFPRRSVGNWCYRAQKMFEEHSMTEIFTDHSIECHHKKFILDKLREKLRSKVISDWENVLNRENAIRGQGSNKLRHYRLFKENFAPEEYVKNTMPINHRRSLAKFRLGVAPLAVEYGRYSGTPLHDRICPNCSIGTETELHVLLECPLYEDLRYDLFQQVLYVYPSFGIFSEQTLFNELLSNDKLYKICAKYCFNILERRNLFTYTVR